MIQKELIKNAEDIAKKFLKLLEIEASCKADLLTEGEEKVLKVSIDGDDLGLLIGYRGNTLNAIQLLFTQMLKIDREEGINVLVDVNNYRVRRNEYLCSLAKKACDEARESKQDIELAPLSSYERRVIHMALQTEKNIKTESAGEGEERHIVVKFIKN